MKGLDAAKLQQFLAPWIKEGERKQLAAHANERRAIAERRQAREREYAAKAPLLGRTLESAEAKLARQRLELEAAQADRDAAFSALAALSADYQRQNASDEARSREIAHPAIATAREDLEAEIERTRHRSSEAVEVIDINQVTEKRTTTVYSAIGSIRRRLEALRAMQLELSKLEVELDADVPARLAELWARIPAVGGTEAFIRQKPQFVK